MVVCKLLKSVLKFLLVWFLICSLKLFVVFKFWIGGGGNIVINVLLIVVNFWFNWVVIVIVDIFGFWCFLKGVSGVNIMLLLGLFVKLFIDRLGNDIVFVIFGICNVIFFIFCMIFWVLFKFVVLGNCVIVIKYCLFCCGIKLFGIVLNNLIVLLISVI